MGVRIPQSLLFLFMDFLNHLIKKGWLKTDRIINAFEKIKREDFVRPDLKDASGYDQALPIGHNQTISQPLVVAFMLEKLDPKPGQKVLDIGSGSGWTTALLAEIVEEKGKVIAIEIIEELMNFGKKNVEKYNFVEKGIVEFFCKDGRKGHKEEAPYDRILASASAKTLPQEWKSQLKEGGKIVAPVKESIFLYNKEEKRIEKKYPGFKFVPLVKNEK